MQNSASRIRQNTLINRLVARFAFSRCKPVVRCHFPADGRLAAYCLAQNDLDMVIAGEERAPFDAHAERIFSNWFSVGLLSTSWTIYLCSGHYARFNVSMVFCGGSVS